MIKCNKLLILWRKNLLTIEKAEAGNDMPCYKRKRKGWPETATRKIWEIRRKKKKSYYPSNGFLIFHTVYSWYLWVLLDFFTTEHFFNRVIQRVFSILFCFSFVLVHTIFKLFHDVWCRSKNKCFYLVRYFTQLLSIEAWN